MVRLASSRDYIGAVRDPETGERVQLTDTDVSAAVAERLTAEYHYLSVQDAGSGVTQETEVEYPTDESGEPLCVGKDEGQCGRVVDDPGDSCWQHS